MARDPDQRPVNGEQNPPTAYDNPETYYGMPQTPDSNPQHPFGMPQYNDPQYQQGFNDGPPPAKPLPPGQAIAQLPAQYFQILMRPSAARFAQEMGKASWGIVFVQLIAWAIISTVLGYLLYLSTPLQSATSISIGASPGTLSPGTIQLIQSLRLISSYGQIILIPVIFFSWVGLIFLLSKAFGGRGTFLEQCYTTLLFQVPLGIVGSVLNFIPFVSLLGIALFIYNIVLQAFATMAVHGLTGGKVTAIIFILLGVLLLILCPLATAFALFITLAQLH